MPNIEYEQNKDGLRYAYQDFPGGGYAHVSERVTGWSWYVYGVTCPGGIESVSGFAKTVDEAWALARQAAQLLGHAPGALVPCEIDSPVVVQDGEVQDGEVQDGEVQDGEVVG